MHPWMTVWIWSEAMSRIFKDSLLGISNTLASRQPDTTVNPAIRLGDYFQSEIVTHPLPTTLLDRLADLYWTEREAELPI